MIILKPKEVLDLESEDIVVVNYNSLFEIRDRIVEYLNKDNRITFADKKVLIEGKYATKTQVIQLLQDFTFLNWTKGEVTYSQIPNFLIDLLVISDFKHMNKVKVKKITEVSISTKDYICLDTETSGPGKNGALDPLKNKIELIQLNTGTEIVICTPRGCSDDDLKAFFKMVFKYPIVGHNLMFDLSTIYAKTGLLPTKIFDTMYADILIKFSKKEGTNYKGVFKNSGLFDVTKKYCKIELDKSEQTSDWGGTWTDKQLQYAENDVKYLPTIVNKEVRSLNHINSAISADIFNLKNKVARLEMKVLLVLIEIRIKGIAVNRPMIEKKIKKAYDAEQEIVKKLNLTFKEVENFNSRDQVLEACRKRGINMPDYTSNTITEYAEKYPDIALLKQHKEITQIPKNLNKYRHDVVYPEWISIGSPPGRMTTKKPSVQNIPRAIKDDFYDPRLNLIRADYPAIELRICAFYVNETSMIDAFNNGEDLHKKTASLVLGKNVEDITKQERQLAKAMNYGLIYGMGGKRFKENAHFMYGVDMTLEEAYEYKEKFYEAYPQIHSWHRDTGIKLQRGGIKIKTILGRTIWYGKDDYSNALNSPIQGSGADMLKLATIALWDRVKEYGARILTLIHDEIIVVVDDQKDIERAKKDLKECMEKSAQVIIPTIKTEVDVDVSLSEDIGTFEENPKQLDLI